MILGLVSMLVVTLMVVMPLSFMSMVLVMLLIG